MRVWCWIIFLCLLPNKVCAEWVPDASLKRPLPRPCDPRIFEQNYLERPSGGKAREDYLLQTVQSCQTHWLNPQHATDVERAFQKLQSLSYSPTFSFRQWPQLELRLANNQTLSAHLAIKAQHSSALVILLCDMTCRMEQDGALKALAMQLHDESPFHLIVVDSISSLAQWRSRSEITLPGFLEADTLLHFGRWLRGEAPFRSQINSLHIVGYGFSALSALWASRLNDENPINSDTKVFQSVVALSPALKLKESLETLVSDNNIANWYQQGLITQLQVARGILADPWDLPSPPSSDNFVDLLLHAGLRALSRINGFNFWLPFRGLGIHDSVTLQRRHNIFSFSEGSQTPTLILSAGDDPLFATQFAELKQKHRLKAGQLQFVSTEHGGVNSFAATYEWMAVSKLLRAFLLGTSADVWIKFEKIPLKTPPPRYQLEPDEKILAQYWGYNPTTQKVELILTTNQSRTLTTPYSPAQLLLAPPQTLDEQVQLIRHLNSHFEVHSTSGLLVDSSEEATQIIRWQ